MFERLNPQVADSVGEKIRISLLDAAPFVDATVVEFLVEVADSDGSREAYAAAIETFRLKLCPPLSTTDRLGDPVEISEAHALAARLRYVDVGSAITAALRVAEAARRPDGYLNPYAPTRAEWNVVETLLDRIGSPVLYADLKKIGGRYYGPSQAVNTVVDTANRNLSAIAPAKTKVGGKSAYLLRASEEKPDSHDGRWSNWRLPEIDAAEISA